jgi:UDP-N-acetyl-D-mannosaminuronic acid dehydrogenase
VNVLTPGPGVGGHCIAVDPWFLVGAAPHAAHLIQAARDVNDGMPEHVIERLSLIVQPPAPVALMGLTYKAEVDDIRESPALRVAELAVERGYAVRLCDPHVRPETPGLPAPLLPLPQAIRDAEAMLLLVNHRAFLDLDVDLVGSLLGRRRVLDARNAIDRTAWESRGFEVSVLGSPPVARIRANA